MLASHENSSLLLDPLRFLDVGGGRIPYDYIFDLSGGYFGSTSSRRFSFSKEANLR